MIKMFFQTSYNKPAQNVYVASLYVHKYEMQILTLNRDMNNINEDKVINLKKKKNIFICVLQITLQSNLDTFPAMTCSFLKSSLILCMLSFVASNANHNITVKIQFG